MKATKENEAEKKSSWKQKKLLRTSWNTDNTDGLS